MSTIKNISRRKFIKNVGLVSGGLILAYHLPSCTGESEIRLADDGTYFNPNLFVQLKKNGELVLLSSRSEMGQGIRTSLTSAIADEMEADWKYVSVKQATGDAIFGDQNTDGSRSIRTILEPMRKMGAIAKAMLITAAANKWQVSESECAAENHYIINKTNNEKVFYGNLVEDASKLEAPKDVVLKDKKNFNYIGKELKSIDVHDFVTGNAKYGIDIRQPNMKFACIARCPVTFGTAKSFNKDEVLKINGVIDVIEFNRIERPFGPLGGIAVIAENTWAAIKGKEALNIEWDYGKNKSYNSEAYLEEITANVHKKGKEIKNEGSVNNAFKNAETLVESTYILPHLVHAPMEVPNATANVLEGSCEVWAPTQTPQTARIEIAGFLKLDIEKVTVNVTFLGGGFGRKSKPDYIVEAVVLSKAIKNPVQVVWTREDDIQNSYYHAVSAQYLKGSLNKDGKVTGWLHRTAFPSIASTFAPNITHGAGFELGLGVTNLPYDIENMRCESGKAIAHVRIGWLRSVCNIFHGFSINVFVDELAAKANKDALEFRLNLFGKNRIIPSAESEHKYDIARLKNVLVKAAKNANYSKKLPKDHGIGLAVHYSFLSYVATAVEVSVIENKLKVHKITTVIDCGLAVNKNSIKAQMEGAGIFGMSLAYYGKITAKDGAIQQSNYHDYPMLRINEAPEFDIEIVESNEKSTGVGEPGVPVIAPAIINAIFNATGKRYYSLPLSDHGLV